jgi:hypothetical protein
MFYGNTVCYKKICFYVLPVCYNKEKEKEKEK